MSRSLALLAVAVASCTRPNPLFLEGGAPTGGSDSEVGEETDTFAGPDATAGPAEPTGGTACDTDCQNPGLACLAPPCPGDLDWLVRTGDGADQRAADVALLADGSVVVVGDFRGTLGDGDHTITATDAAGDAFVLRLDPAGRVQWIRRYGGDGAQQITAVTVLADDVLAITGRFTTELVTDNHDIPPIGTTPGFVAALTPADGSTTTLHLIGGDDVVLHDIAPGPGGAVLVAGAFSGNILFPTQKHTSDGVDAFAARLDLGSGFKWIFAATAPGDQHMRAIARGPDDTTIVAGEFSGDFLLGLVVAGRDGFVAHLDKSGLPQSAMRLGGPGDDRLHALAVAPDGAFVIAGTHDGLDLGAGVLPHTPGAHDGFLAAFDPGGALRWSEAGFVLAHDASALALTADGALVAALPVGGAVIDLGDARLPGAPGLLLVHIAPDGRLTWARRIEGTLAPTFGLAAGAARIAVAGAFDATLSHGGDLLQSAGEFDVFAGLLRLP